MQRSYAMNCIYGLVCLSISLLCSAQIGVAAEFTVYNDTPDVIRVTVGDRVQQLPPSYKWVFVSSTPFTLAVSALDHDTNTTQSASIRVPRSFIVRVLHVEKQAVTQFRWRTFRNQHTGKFRYVIDNAVKNTDYARYPSITD